MRDYQIVALIMIGASLISLAWYALKSLDT